MSRIFVDLLLVVIVVGCSPTRSYSVFFYNRSGETIDDVRLEGKRYRVAAGVLSPKSSKANLGLVRPVPDEAWLRWKNAAGEEHSWRFEIDQYHQGSVGGWEVRFFFQGDDDIRVLIEKKSTVQSR